MYGNPTMKVQKTKHDTIKSAACSRQPRPGGCECSRAAVEEHAEDLACGQVNDKWRRRAVEGRADLVEGGAGELPAAVSGQPRCKAAVITELAYAEAEPLETLHHLAPAGHVMSPVSDDTPAQLERRRSRARRSVLSNRTVP
jgi:hypothetical protein